MSEVRHRLDGFVDAAFAFSISLIATGVVGADGSMAEELRVTLGQVPPFAIGFVILSMFWFEHVSWRRHGGNGHWTAALLSLLLVFLVVTFVMALRPMAEALSAFLLNEAHPALDRPMLIRVFRIYGAGFAMMCTVTMLLFLQGMRFGKPAAPRLIRGRAIVYGLLASVGALSTALTLWPQMAWAAPWVYLVLPPGMALFGFLYRWTD
jgi:uncharacterized membrane protein